MLVKRIALLAHHARHHHRLPERDAVGEDAYSHDDHEPNQQLPRQIPKVGEAAEHNGGVYDDGRHDRQNAADSGHVSRDGGQQPVCAEFFEPAQRRGQHATAEHRVQLKGSLGAHIRQQRGRDEPGCDQYEREPDEGKQKPPDGADAAVERGVDDGDERSVTKAAEYACDNDQQHDAARVLHAPRVPQEKAYRPGKVAEESHELCSPFAPAAWPGEPMRRDRAVAAR